MGEKKLLLINAIHPNTQRKSNYFEPRSLGIIAALTPDSWEIEILDQNIEDFSYRPANIVAISSYTDSINEAYRISAIYMSHNIPVIIGGAHASILPEEVSQYATSAVVGDAESTWPKILQDFDLNQFQKVYYGSSPNVFQLPKRVKYLEQYYAATVETSRGCPMNCDFCSVPALHKNKYYIRPVEEIIAEIKSIKSKNIFFSDDNMYGVSEKNKERFREICQKMIDNKINKNWIGFASLNIAKDNESLILAHKSGCKLLMIGFESEDNNILKAVNKTINYQFSKEDIIKYVKKIQSHHIGIIGGFIFGFEQDSVESINLRRNFIKSLKIDIISFTPLTPFPGTQLFQRLFREKRLVFNEFPEDWSRYRFCGFAFKHPTLSKDDIEQVYRLNSITLYSKRNFYSGLLNSLIRTKSFKTVKHIYEFKTKK